MNRKGLMFWVVVMLFGLSLGMVYITTPEARIQNNSDDPLSGLKSRLFASAVAAQPVINGDAQVAQSTPTNRVSLFSQFDLNHDQQLSPEELRDASTFQKMDKDGNGLITRDELRPETPPHPRI